jgi:hypothetical protein
VPTIAIIAGVRVVIYPKDHLPPHLHAMLGGQSARISILTGEVLEGDLPRSKLRAVLEWLAANRPRVAYAWREIVERNGSVGRIDE